MIGPIQVHVASELIIPASTATAAIIKSRVSGEYKILENPLYSGVMAGKRGGFG